MLEKMATSDDFIPGDLLLSYIERIERLQNTKREILDGIKDVYDEVKSAGFDVKTVRRIVKIRSMRAEEAEREEILLNLYKNVLGI